MYNVTTCHEIDGTCSQNILGRQLLDLSLLCWMSGDEILCDVQGLNDDSMHCHLTCVLFVHSTVSAPLPKTVAYHALLCHSYLLSATSHLSRTEIVGGNTMRSVCKSGVCRMLLLPATEASYANCLEFLGFKISIQYPSGSWMNARPFIFPS